MVDIHVCSIKTKIVTVISFIDFEVCARYIYYRMITKIRMKDGKERKIHCKKITKFKLIVFGVEMHWHLILNCHPILRM